MYLILNDFFYLEQLATSLVILERAVQRIKKINIEYVLKVTSYMKGIYNIRERNISRSFFVFN